MKEVVAKMKDWTSRQVTTFKTNRALRLYGKGQYDKMAKIFKSHAEYATLKFDAFPFIYHIIGTAEHI